MVFGAVKSYLKPNKTGQTTQSAASNEKGADTAGTGVQYGAASTSGQSGSRVSSRPASLYPHGDFRNSNADEIVDIKCDVMVNWLHQQQLESMWSAGTTGEGVILKRRKDQFISCPSELASEPFGLYQAVRALNVRVWYTHAPVEMSLTRSRSP
jgi:hypothetical protein